MKKIHIQSIALASLAAGFNACADNDKKSHENEKPNFLFVLVDDMGWMDASLYGNTFYETPNLERLASQGMLFTNGYASCPVCSPTRVSIMTGKYPVNHKVTDWIPGRQKHLPKEDYRKLMSKPFGQQMELEEITIAEVLQNNGYKTQFTGKWHMGSEGFFPQDQGFDNNIGGCEKGGPYGKNGYFHPFGAPVPGNKGDFLTDKLTDYTINFIRQNKDSSFLAYLSFYTLHNPIMAPDSLVEKYEAKAEAIGYTNEERFTEDKAWINAIPEDHKGYKERLVQDNAVYAAMVEVMDNNVGKLLDVLEELKIDDNTVIIFTADNGGLSTSEGSNTCNAPLRAGKGWLYEGGIREPLIITWPGVTTPGSKSDVVATSVDYYPTMLEMAGIDVPEAQKIDGISLVSALKGDTSNQRAIFWHYPHYANQGCTPGSAIRKGKYKLIYWMETESMELFDLENDISETTDVSETLPEVKNELWNELSAWLKANNAQGMDVNPDYKPYSRK